MTTPLRAGRGMRIIHVITRLVVGGAQENTVASVLGLRRFPDVDSSLVAGPTEGPEGSLESSFQSSPDLLIRVPSLVRPVRPWLDFVAWRSLAALFRRTRPDIVHTHSGKAGIVGRLAARTARVPIVVHTIHGPSFGPFQGPVPNLVFRTAERLAGWVTDHFVVVARAMARDYLAAGIGRPEQFTRIVSGFDLAPYFAAKSDPSLRNRLGLGSDDFVVGKVARLFENKGHADLVRAAPSLVRTIPKLKFLLVGDGLERDRLAAEIRRRGLGDRFLFTGLVPPCEVPRYLAEMDVLVHLSRREGLPRALPQALATGRPVVAYDRDGANEICVNGRTGYLVPPGNLHALEERLRLLARDPGLRAQLGRQGREIVRELFPVENMIRDLHALYVRLSDEHSPRRRRSRSPFSSPTALP